jgi:syntaxin-binding protein 1
MAQDCMALFEKEKLSDVASVEQVCCILFAGSHFWDFNFPQCCATGLTSEGKSPKSLVEEMVPLLDSREVL